ncbi:HAD hydrolase family protein [Treponema sp.]|uniref:HAD hydrolase family protein n=1 Tax=Treponema sp. TaxID=166 RepID=UPI00298DE862|nr:HAD hydrolase family protein [Treponema sp.]MCQ2240340.1 HAD hydrolase family protein [Treponema sp.]
MPKFPPVGARIIKSAIAMALCYAVDYLRGESGIIFYIQLSALWCIQSYISTTKKNAIQRTIGTCIGAVFGLIVLLIVTYLKNKFKLSHALYYFINAFLISFTIVPLIWTTVTLKKKQACYFSCVVFLSIVVIHMADENCFLFVWNRFLDTMIGIIIGVTVNLFHFPRKKHREILFISGLDDTLLNKDYHLNDYCKVELNRMLDEGMNFTLSTMRPPAAIMEPMAEIRLKLPVIAMDGAVMYDTKEKRYLSKIELTKNEKNRVHKLLEENNLVYFANVVVNDTLLIYFKEPETEIQSTLINELRKSPYRNYIKRPLPQEESVVYFMLIYPTEKIEEIYSLLEHENITESMKVLKYPSTDYPGHSYIKIFNSKATRNNMIENLKMQLNIEKTVTFGTIEGKYDHVVEKGNTNEVVHTLKRLFE